MKKLAIIIAVAGFVGTPAFAADMAVKMPIKAPPPAPAPVYSWTGFYVGLNAGGGWANTTIDNSATQSSCDFPPTICSAFLAAIPGQFDPHPSGFIGGGQIGYNYQLTPNWVAGLEADFQGADIKGSASVAPFTTVVSGLGNTVISSGAGDQKLDWFGTVRGRLGWLPVNPLLVYATGGLAYGHVKTEASFSGTLAPFFNENGSTISSGSTTRAGWTVGGGCSHHVGRLRQSISTMISAM